MKIKKKYYFQLTLLLFSVVMSAFSFLNVVKGGEEFYPFFYWKLYTKPSGWEYNYKDYRLYGVTRTKDTIRIENNGYYLFDKDDYSYFIGNESMSIIGKQYTKQYYISRINAFAKSLDVYYGEYLIIEEEFNPIEVYENNKNYTTKVIFSTK